MLARAEAKKPMATRAVNSSFFIKKFLRVRQMLSAILIAGRGLLRTRRRFASEPPYGVRQRKGILVYFP
jgi:hypothetical protein